MFFYNWAYYGDNCKATIMSKDSFSDSLLMYKVAFVFLFDSWSQSDTEVPLLFVYKTPHIETSSASGSTNPRPGIQYQILAIKREKSLSLKFWSPNTDVWGELSQASPPPPTPCENKTPIR